jgi:hypothetical protein
MKNVLIGLALFGVLCLVTYLLGLIDKIKLKKEVRRSWGKPARRTRRDGEASLKEAWQTAVTYRQFDSQVDDLTWHDLDLWSVFQKLNSTKSSIGSEALYQRLRNFDFSSEDNDRLAQLIHFFEDQVGIREQLLYQFARLGKKDHNCVERYLSETKSQKLPQLHFYLVCAALPFASLLLAVFFPIVGVTLLLGAFVFNICYYQFNKVALEAELESMSYLVQTVAIGSKIANSPTPFQKELQQNLAPIQMISKLGLSFRVKTDSEMAVIFDYLNAVVMLPFISYHLVLAKLMHHDQAAKRVWHLLGELEVALAVLNLQQSSLGPLCQPTFTDTFQVIGEAVCHPLLQNPVANPVNWQKPTLITGSNASGKSTYVKALAINCILANAINRTFASRFSLPKAHLVTSMAIEDNIFEGDSYFIAEIKSVKRVLDLVAAGQPCLYFVDEILKGTNTIERISASASMIAWLAASPHTLGFVATHDIELTEILADICDNVHFEEQVTQENGVTFDYQCHLGPAKTRNAIKLLAVLEYPETIVRSAEMMAESFDQTRSWQVLES